MSKCLPDYHPDPRSPDGRSKPVFVVIVITAAMHVPAYLGVTELFDLSTSELGGVAVVEAALAALVAAKKSPRRFCFRFRTTFDLCVQGGEQPPGPAVAGG